MLRQIAYSDLLCFSSRDDPHTRHDPSPGDLKPGNVLLTSARVDRRGFIAKLADFGLSHVAHGPIATNTWGVSSGGCRAG